jgi:hypothetical protein
MTKALAWEMVVTRELETNEPILRRVFMLMFMSLLPLVTLYPKNVVESPKTTSFLGA